MNEEEGLFLSLIMFKCLLSFLKGLFGVIVLTKKPMNFFKEFLP